MIEAMAREFEKPVHLLRYRASQFEARANEWILLYGDEHTTVEGLRRNAIVALIERRKNELS